MRAYFLDLFEYNFNSNLLTIGLLEKFNSLVPQKSIDAFSHILNAHHLWNHRIDLKPPRFGVWSIHKIEKLGMINQELFEQSKEIIIKHDLSVKVTYKNTAGEVHTNSNQEILTHIVNHSTYHRGQVMLQLRESGLDAIATDYIFYKR